MVSAIVLAGGPVTDSVTNMCARAYYKFIYNETYLWGSYKPTLPYKLDSGFGPIVKPMINFVVHAVSQSTTIDDIVVVGESAILSDQRVLGSYVGKVPLTLVQQVGSIVQNGVCAYEKTRAYKTGEGVVIIPCDIPQLQPLVLDEFVKQSQQTKTLAGESAQVTYALIEKRSITDPLFHRPYFWLRDDRFEAQNELRGFRLANLTYCKPQDVSHIFSFERLYALRKLKDPLNWGQLLVDAPSQLVRYVTQQLSVSEVELFLSKMFGASFAFVQVKHPQIEDDVDEVRESVGRK
jgi:hypothetical protein